MVRKYGMVHTAHKQNGHIPPSVPHIEMMYVTKNPKNPRTRSVGSQTDPVHVSLKSRRDMGFKLHPHPAVKSGEDMHGFSEEMAWIRDYWAVD